VNFIHQTQCSEWVDESVSNYLSINILIVEYNHLLNVSDEELRPSTPAERAFLALQALVQLRADILDDS
jgi:hypothetical protein